MYKLGTNCVMKFDGDEFLLCIPFDPDNTDYQAFLLWKSEGNEPLPADE
jgi:hypothetical protein